MERTADTCVRFAENNSLRSEKLRGRNYGIDLLRIVAMFFVCVLHVLGHGGVLEKTVFLSVNYCAAWGIEIAALCAVDCYALVSGYVGVDAKFKISNIIYLWAQVELYSVTISLFFAVFYPESFDGAYAEIIIKSFLPATTVRYWYFSAYFGMFLLMPVLNCALTNMSEKYLKRTLMTVLTVITVLTAINDDLFELNAGYGTLWLVVLYLLGGYVKKYGVFVNSRKAVLIGYLFISIFITWGAKILYEVCSDGGDSHTVTDTVITYGYGYTSPTVVLISVIMLKLFSEIPFKKKIKTIGFFSQTSFGVYLIHENPFIRNFFINGRFVFFSEYNFFIMALCIIGVAFSIYVICSAIDYLRLMLFKLVRLKRYISAIENILKSDIST